MNSDLELGFTKIPLHFEGSYSQFSTDLVLFTDGDTELTFEDALLNKEFKQSIEKEYSIDYKQCCSGPYPKVEWISSFFNVVIHPIHLFRFFEKCHFEKALSDQVLLNILGDSYRPFLEKSDEEDSDYEEQKPVAKKQLKKKRKTTGDVNSVRLASLIRESENFELENSILRLCYNKLNSQNSVTVDPSCEIPSLKYCNLKENTDMLTVILEFIGDVRTLKNFAMSSHFFLEAFQQANTNHILFKRLMKDFGLIAYNPNVQPQNLVRGVAPPCR